MTLWNYSEEKKELVCEDSIEIVQPLSFQDMNQMAPDKHQKIFLFKAHTDEIFWFSQQGQNLAIDILEANKKNPLKMNIDKN